MHRHCLVKFRRQKNSCPSCNNAWPQDAKDKQLLPVGEDAVKDGQDGKRQTRIRSTEQSDEDAESEEDPEPSQDLTPQNNTQKGRRKPVRADNSMDVDPAEEASQPQRTRRSSRR